jgi:predicted RNase H-like HicB family nuclease/uncharacterized damage-inducible protein DinB
MKIYPLYLESGPKKKKTMVHILDLLGCIAQGPTTEDALAATPEAIRAYLRFLQRHGAPADPEAPFEVQVAEHCIEGYFLGQGSTAVTYAPDRLPLLLGEVEPYLQRLEWSRADLVALVQDQRIFPYWDAAPVGGGRSVRAILWHIAESEGSYVRTGLGGVPAISQALRAAEKGEIDLLTAMARAREVELERVRAMTPEEGAQAVWHGQALWTARKMLRRMLEHEWEHLMELSRRAAGSGA